MTGKGTPSKGKHNRAANHIPCRRCGKRSYNKNHHRCSHCGFPAARIRKYPGWGKRVHAHNGIKKFNP